MKVSVLWTAPEVNPHNNKARSIPVLNPFDKYGRTFFFSWLGFLIAFWSWYAFPPLLTKTIRDDLNLKDDPATGLYNAHWIPDSNIVALAAGLVFRFASGPLCDRFGPRKVFASLLLAGALPTALAGTITNGPGLIVLRFFVGILGATFVPCQVWTTAFYDKNVVGSANALVGGWGNAGGGITYFAMPAILDSLVGRQNLTPHVAWRVAFIVPFILITSTAIGMLLFCEDTPTGKWSERHLHAAAPGTIVNVASVPEQKTIAPSSAEKGEKDYESGSDTRDVESGTGTVDEYTHEVVQKPTGKAMLKVLLSPQSIALAMAYFNSFGSELAINSVLGAYYLKNFPYLGQTGAGQRAAMFGLVNVVFRPAGGFVADLLYKYTNGSLWAKKMWIHFLGVAAGAFCLAIGLLDPTNLATMIGLVIGLALFMDAGNGATFGLVPHVHPHANGVISGFVGATGNFGGIIFAIIFRYTGNNYHQSIWIIGVFFIAINVAVSWIRPIPSSQIGGR